MSITRAALATALAAPLLAAPVVALPAYAGGECAGRAEYDDIHDGQSLNTVQNITGIPGSYDPAGPGTFGRRFRTCWAPGEVRIVVIFGNDTGLVERKRTEQVD